MRTACNRAHMKWTNEEIEYLFDKRGQYTLATIAGKLGRSVGAVKNKVTELGIGTMSDNSEYMGSGEAAEYLGISRRTLTENVVQGKIKAIVRSPNKQKLYFFSEKELERFKAENPKREVRKFTPYEIATIRGLYYRGVSYSQIAKRLRRHKNTISNKIIAMRQAGEI